MKRVDYGLDKAVAKANAEKVKNKLLYCTQEQLGFHQNGFWAIKKKLCLKKT